MIDLYPPERSFQRFKKAILNWKDVNNYDAFLLNETPKLREYYTPFDFVNENAKLCIVGITPGKTQLKKGLQEAKRLLLAKPYASDEDILKEVKPFGAFSGGLRTWLIRILNRIGIPEVLGLSDSSDLFNKQDMPVHFTSALNNCLFIRNGNTWKDYNNSVFSFDGKDIDLLDTSINNGLLKEVELLKKCIFLPIGVPCNEIFRLFVQEKVIDENRVIFDCIHASGSQSSRIAFFCGQDPNVHSNMSGVDNVEKRIEYNKWGLRIREQTLEKFSKL